MLLMHCSAIGDRDVIASGRASTHLCPHVVLLIQGAILLISAVIGNTTLTFLTLQSGCIVLAKDIRCGCVSFVPSLQKLRVISTMSAKTVPGKWFSMALMDKAPLSLQYPRKVRAS